MTVSLSKQPQIPVIAPVYRAAHKHVWEEQRHTETHQHRRIGRSDQLVLVMISIWNEDLIRVVNLIEI